jgi:hypothetical protein
MSTELERARRAVQVEAGRKGQAILQTKASYDPKATAARARDGQFAKFCREQDPEGKLDDATLRRMHGAELNRRLSEARLAKQQKRLRRLNKEAA